MPAIRKIQIVMLQIALAVAIGNASIFPWFDSNTQIAN